MKIAPRQAAPGQSFGYTAPGGEQRTMTADGEGVVRPKDEDEARVLDSFGLPIAQKPTKKAAPAATED